ncbi:MAG: ATP-binding protein [Minicystis sp.]
MNTILRTILLPAHVSDFERRYLARMNRVGLGFFALHLPVFVVIAALNGTGPLLAALLTLAVLVVPVAAYLALENPRAISMTYGFTAMLMGGLLVHFGQGPVQIEMHFYFFALIAMLALYGNPMVILVAAGTVALHHLALWAYLPSSVFNYQAALWVVAVHAGFVVLESVGAVFIARSFFDNVIGLERIVNERTAQLARRNREMRLVLDNAKQGFVTAGVDGVMSSERSAVVDRWLGAPTAGMTFADYFAQVSPSAGDALRCGFEQVAEGILPPEVSLDQMPKRVVAGGRVLDIDYIVIGEGDELDKVLVVISDVTRDVLRSKVEAEQRELLGVVQRILADKAGFLEFVSESEAQMKTLAEGGDPVVQKRALHTLKGNAGVFELHSLVEIYHAMETRLVEEGELPTEEQRRAVAERWGSLRADLAMLFGEGEHSVMEIDDEDYGALLKAVLEASPHEEIARMIRGFKLEPAGRRLNRIAEQARGMARRLNKGALHVGVHDHHLRLDGTRWARFWSAFVHVVRNAVDHGIEPADERRTLGKPEQGKLDLSVRLDETQLVVEISDDGRGIDWTKIAERARAKGLSAASSADLVKALLEGGISTRESASEYSGRGLGMGAVRAACDDLDGVMEIHSDQGKGTRVEFRFPTTQMAPQRPSLSQAQ